MTGADSRVILRWVRYASLIVVLATAGCGGKASSTVAQTVSLLGLEDAPVLPTRTAKVIIDATLQSPATTESLTATIDQVVPDVAKRPAPSCVELWVMRGTDATTERLGETCVGPRERTPQLQRETDARYAATARTYLLSLAEHAFDERARTSPIAAAITRAALERNESAEQVIVLVSDAREHASARETGKARTGANGVISFECGALPTPKAFEAALHEDLLLEPGLLAGTEVHFAYVGFTDAKRPGCSTSVKRELQIQALWRSALTRASARSVHFTSAAPRFSTPEAQP